MSTQADTLEQRLLADVERLGRAVRRLEEALAERDRRDAEAAGRMAELRAEVEGLRTLQQTVADRLDGAIERLTQAQGD